MSKFEDGCFCGGYDDYAVSKEKFTREDAIKIAIDNLSPHPASNEKWTLAIGNCWVRHRAGVNEDGEPQVGWWLEYADCGRNCPSWCFHVARHDAKHSLEREYEHIQVVNGAAHEAGEVKHETN